MTESRKMAVKMEVGPIRRVEFEPEEAQMVMDLIEKRMMRIQRKKQHDIVDLIIVHALQSLLRKMAS